MRLRVFFALALALILSVDADACFGRRIGRCWCIGGPPFVPPPVLLPVPAPAGTLTLSNVRYTSGIFGQERKTCKFQPGDTIVVSFDIDGLQVTPNGEVKYSIGTELAHQNGKKEFVLEPVEMKAVASLGGSRSPAYAFLHVGTDTAPGEYVFTIIVSDSAAKDKPTEETVCHFEVLPKQLGIVAVQLEDNKGIPVPPVAVPGQTVVVEFKLVGFDRDKMMNPDVTFEMAIRDAYGRKAVEKPSVLHVSEPDPKNPDLIPSRFTISPNRSGDYTIELKATDNISKTSVVEKMKIRVIDLPR